jgi:arsenate reductase-like glutaredoxin family protein
MKKDYWRRNFGRNTESIRRKRGSGYRKLGKTDDQESKDRGLAV